MRKIAAILLAALLLLSSASAEGLFDSLLPVTPTPTLAPAPEPTAVPPAEDNLAERLCSAGFTALFGLPERVETAEGLVLRYAGMTLEQVVSLLQLLDEAQLTVVRYDAQTGELLLYTGGMEAAATAVPVREESRFCEACRGSGRCLTCYSFGEIDCSACYDGTCRYCVDGYVYAFRGQKVDCSKCDGTDRCHVCQGQKSFDCPDCSDGRCTVCGGSRYQ